MKNRVVIIDYGMGNLNSIRNKLNRINVQALISSDIKDIEMADKIILPGVGHFKKAMENLFLLNIINVLNKEVIFNKKPILGICLGMQLFSAYSEEGNYNGLNWLNAKVERFKIDDTLLYKVPHTGWNQIKIVKKSKLLEGVEDNSFFYFVHSFHYKTSDTSIILSTTNYEKKFVSAVEKDNIYGVQFHPEKSHDIGEVILKNFIKL